MITSDLPPNPSPLTNAVCMHCGYDISGTIPDNDAQVTCPECGVLLKRSDQPALTRRDVQLSLLKSIVLPFFIWSAITVLSVAPLPFRGSMFAMFVVLLFALGYPIALLVVTISAWSRLHHRTRIYPRPYHRGLIPLWILAYLIPTASLYPLVFIVLQSAL